MEKAVAMVKGRGGGAHKVWGYFNSVLAMLKGEPTGFHPILTGGGQKVLHLRFSHFAAHTPARG